MKKTLFLFFCTCFFINFNAQGFLYKYNNKGSLCKSSIKINNKAYITGGTWLGKDTLFAGNYILGIDSMAHYFMERGFTPDTSQFLDMYYNQNNPADEVYMLGYSNGGDYVYISAFDNTMNLKKSRKLIYSSLNENIIINKLIKVDKSLYLAGLFFNKKIPLERGIGLLFMKYDWENGRDLVYKTFLDSISIDDDINIVEQDKNIIVSFTKRFTNGFKPINKKSNEFNYWRFDTLGNILSKKYLTEEEIYCRGKMIINTPNDIILAGSVVDKTFFHYRIGDSIRFTSCFIAAIDSNMNIKWKSKIGASNVGTEYNTLLKTKNGDYLVAGSNRDRVGIPDADITDTGTYWGIIARYNKDGNSIWQKEFNTVRPSLRNTCKFNSVEEFSNGNILAIGEVEIGDGKDSIVNQVWLLLLDKDGKVLTSSIENTHEVLPFSIFPNPSSQYIQWDNSYLINKIQIFDLNGKLIQEESNIDNKLDVENFPKGIYLGWFFTKNGEKIFYSRFEKK